jgi:hypothetical protein
MKCVDRYTICVRPDHASETIPHIASGVIREGETEDIGWEIVSLVEDIGYPCSEDLCFSASRSGDHEDRSVDGFDGVTLSSIESCKYVLY